MKNLNRSNDPRGCENDMRKSVMTESTCTKLALTGLLVFAVGYSISAMVSPVMAGPPACDSGEISKRCKNDDGSLLVAKFCLAISDQTPGLAGDGSDSDDGFYCDKNKEDKLLVFTGKGPGFRFDTKQGKGKSVAARFVEINFPDGTMVEDADGNSHTYASGPYEIDFRFDVDSGGLGLGGIANPGTGTVPVGIRILELNGSELGLLGYGNAPSLFSDPSLDTKCMVDNTHDALVTRIDAISWTIESDPAYPPYACLWVGHANFGGQSGEVVDMPFFFTIVIDDS